jgi:hypothetical protein
MSGRIAPGVQQGKGMWCRLWLLTLPLVACDARSPAASDPHDPGEACFRAGT